MKKKEFICIVCPLSCKIKINKGKNGSLSFIGQTCKRGQSYARAEYTHPCRYLTTTIRIKSAKIPLLPVRSSAPLPKENLFPAQNILKNKIVSAPIKCGEVIIKNILDTKIDIIATRSLS